MACQCIEPRKESGLEDSHALRRLHPKTVFVRHEKILRDERLTLVGTEDLKENVHIAAAVRSVQISYLPGHCVNLITLLFRDISLRGSTSGE